LSEIAIENARRNAGESRAEKVVFQAENIFASDLKDKRFDLVSLKPVPPKFFHFVQYFVPKC
jgi:hypothetical protein